FRVEGNAVVGRAGNVVAATGERERIVGAPVGKTRFGEVHAAFDPRGKLRAAHRDDAVVLHDAGCGAVGILMGELAVAAVVRGKQHDMRCVDRPERRRRKIVDDGTVAYGAGKGNAETTRMVRAIAGGSAIGKALLRSGVAAVGSEVARSGC